MPVNETECHAMVAGRVSDGKCRLRVGSNDSVHRDRVK